MKVTLISPYPDITSFGIRTISAYLKQHHFSTQLIFLPDPFADSVVTSRKRYEEKALDEVAQLCSHSDLVGVTLMTNFFDGAVQITKNIKSKLNIPVIWGGIHPTVRPEECLSYADMVCIGDGEDSMLELVQKMEMKTNYHDVQNIWFRKNGNIIKNSMRPLEQDIDKIASPDYDLEDNYILDNYRIIPVNDIEMEKQVRHSLFSLTVKHPSYMTLSGRGCPHNCTYCCNDNLRKLYHGQKYLRWRSTEHVIGELAAIKEKFPYIKYFCLSDDSFFARNIDKIKEFCAEYKKEIHMPFYCLGSPMTITEEKLEYLIDAGLDAIQMGIETGSKHMQEVFNRKYMTNERVMKAIGAINKHKDRLSLISYDFILDVPYETDEDKVETLEFISRIPKPYKIGMFAIVVYPGTSLYDRVKKDNLIIDEETEIYHKKWSKKEAHYLNLLLALCKSGKFPHFLLRILISKPVLQVLNSDFLKPTYKLLFYLLKKINYGIKSLRNFIKPPGA